MVLIQGGYFSMGTNDLNSYPSERPEVLRKVESFWTDETEVTNMQFAAFVEARGYVSVAEL
jgi:formylglycine-generating enzyme